MSGGNRSGPTEVVLVTGGSGFLGQHLIKQLLERKQELGIKEIRSLDIVPYRNNIGHEETTLLRTFVADIAGDREPLDPIFAGVDGVFHCAASVKIEYPPNYDELERVNVKDTPTLDSSTLWEQDNKFLIQGYASSKLRAENIVLNSNGAPLQNQQEYLATSAIRAPLTYGECDSHFITEVFEYLSTRGWVFPRIAGVGGKQQLVYAGNVAWGHICAYKALKVSDRAVNGLPVFVTDDTGINDVSRFVQKMAVLGERFRVRTSWWYVPHFLFFFLAFLLEAVVRVAYPYTKYRLRYSLRALASYTSSMLMYNRLRASIHMDYMPLYDPDESAERSAKWYARWWDERQQAKKLKKSKSS
ncbi:hypothetical protein M5D96_005602 [Drosophila gunungcola]|uniref:3-beta hydroxysteroid dehydrogenase/isomerase domain-containing protein n=1 Tax=Drosophila gunungcola TaxID=103775 RepID=A0A9Q0BRQ0_9MUSC|nr:hypothetical protein M5D96_005602 [Drosophila gunungcola]